MKEINVQSTKWNELSDVDSVVPFSDSDADCIRELRDVLIKYDCLDRFGISLLHTHFDISDDELLLETTDIPERTQLIRPVKIKDYYDGNNLSLMTTALRLVKGDTVAVQYCGCAKDKHGHTGGHSTT